MFDLSGAIKECRNDEDFDGFFETRSLFLNELVWFVYTDSNPDGFVDVFSCHNHAVIVFAEKFYGDVSAGVRRGKVGRVNYELGYPGLEELKNIKGGRKGFHDYVQSLVKKIKSSSESAGVSMCGFKKVISSNQKPTVAGF